MSSCDFCGFVGQVKTVSVPDTQAILDLVLGAAWGPQEARMQAGIYFRYSSLPLAQVKCVMRTTIWQPIFNTRHSSKLESLSAIMLGGRDGRGSFNNLRDVKQRLVQLDEGRLKSPPVRQ
jgi:hypothetical protein